MTEFLKRAVERAVGKIKLPFAAIVKSSTAALLYTLDRGLSRVNRQDIEALQHYGLVSRLPAGTRVLVIPRMGATEKLVIVSEAHQTALSLSEGDVAIERQSGEHVLLSAGEIRIKASGGTVVVDCATATINAEAVNLGGAGGKALATEDLLTLYNLHTHPHGDPAGVTGVPAVPAALEKTVKTKAL